MESICRKNTALKTIGTDVKKILLCTDEILKIKDMKNYNLFKGFGYVTGFSG
jgi:hypothetical protein